MDYNSAQPVIMMGAANRVLADDGETGPVLDTLGWSKLWVILNNGTTTGQAGKFFVEFSEDGTTFSRPDASAGMLAGIDVTDTVESVYFDLSAEMRYARILYEFPTATGTAEQATAVTGVLMDPASTDQVTHEPRFIAAAHNRA